MEESKGKREANTGGTVRILEDQALVRSAKEARGRGKTPLNFQAG